MTDNEIISAWRGETPCSNWYLSHASKGEYRKNIGGCKCKKCVPSQLYPMSYDKYCGLWDEGLWNEIKESKLNKIFAQHLEINLLLQVTMTQSAFYETYCETDYEDVFDIIRATPAQKARALVQAIADAK